MTGVIIFLVVAFLTSCYMLWRKTRFDPQKYIIVSVKSLAEFKHVTLCNPKLNINFLNCYKNCYINCYKFNIKYKNIFRVTSGKQG